MGGSSQSRRAWRRQGWWTRQGLWSRQRKSYNKIRDLKRSDIEYTTKSEMLFSLLIKSPFSFTTILAIILTMKLTTITVTFRTDSIF